MKILITGASGFVGSHLVRYATEKEHTVVSAVRSSSSISHLKALPTHVHTFSYESESLFEKEIIQLKKDFGSFDLVIHNAALTKSIDSSKLFDTNHKMAIRLARFVEKHELLGKAGKFVFVSSLAARGPDNILKPVTSYGSSKLLAEQEMLQLNLPLVIVRPTAVYGPGDSEFLKLFKVIKWRIAPLIAHPGQKLSFIYVKDLARLLVDYAISQPNRSIITATDGSIYSPTVFYSEVGKSIGVNPLCISIPFPLTMAYSHANFFLSHIFRHNPTLNPEKMRELTADWTPSHKDNPPEGFYFTSLIDGLAETASHYKNLGLL